MRLEGGLSIIIASAATSFADPRFEIGAGVGVEHLSGGTCTDGGFAAPCSGHIGPSLQIDVSEDFELRREISVIARQLGSVGHFETGTLVRGFLGVGVRVSLTRSLYVELTAGGETMFGDTGTGESGTASGASFAVAPRIGVRLGRWLVAVNGMWMPQATDVGLADYDVGVLGSIAIGD